MNAAIIVRKTMFITCLTTGVLLLQAAIKMAAARAEAQRQAQLQAAQQQNRQNFLAGASAWSLASLTRMPESFHGMTLS